MNTKSGRTRINAVALAAAISCTLLSPLTAQSAPGTLADSPLFLSNSVEPNILFMIDDSGSMDWGIMTVENSGLMNMGCAYYYTQPAPDNDYYWMVATERSMRDRGVAAPYQGVWRAWNKDYNRLYYDPSITYGPWPGEDGGGNQFKNAIPTAALYDPYLPSVGSLDLTVATSYTTDNCAAGIGSLTVNNFIPARYNVWDDTDGDGFVDADDAHNLVEIIPATATYPGGANRQDCISKTVCTYAEEIQNFANWFSYYRKREYVAKAGYGQVIAGASNSRMGLLTLHNNNSVKTAMGSMNDDPRTGAKRSLLKNLYSFQASGGTPLRSSVDNAGKYLSCESNSYFSSCPALPVATGGECQQNFTLLMTDGYYNGSFGGLGNTDGDNNTKWDSASTGPYGDGNSNTLADIAMEYYEDDIRPGIDNELNPPPGGIDENKAQHMVTYSVAFGVDGTLTDMPANTTDAFTWPTPNTDPKRIDDLRHAAFNGRGEFLSAQNPTQLITGLRGALQSIQGRVGSAASVAFNTGSLSTNSQVYLALFNSERWNGNLLAYDLNAKTGVISTTPAWSAASRLDTRNVSKRNLITHDGTDGVALKWGSLAAAQKKDFRTNSSGSLDNAAIGKARLGYVRGDRGCEFSSLDACNYTAGTDTHTTKSFRERGSRLGDIIHSGPVYVGTPESNWPDTAPFPGTAGDTYSEFRVANAERPGVIYVGGNDGMMHGFAQSNGNEVLGYVPNMLYSENALEGMHYLSDPSYSHRYSVDLTASVADVYAKTTAAGAVSWKTVLVGGLRAGGRGIFALDVTDPTTFSDSGTAPENTVMWEFTSADDADLGYTFSRPSIVPMQGSSGNITWAAIFGNGYNDAGSGEAKLFIVFIEGGLDGVWSASDYVEITTGVGSTTDRNGLSTPAVVDTDGDGLADRAYAGDLKGNMWAFDLSGSNSGNWDVAYKQGNVVKPLFTAPSNQQLTSVPVIVRNSEIPTSNSNDPNILVIFGSGQYLTPGDVSTTNTQTMYGIWDSGSNSITQGDLTAQTIGYGTSVDGVFGRTLTDNSISYGSSDGWFIDLPDSGERVITDPVIRGDLVFFNTMTPDTNPCNFGGSGWLMVAKWSNGGYPSEVAFDLNNDHVLDDNDKIGSAPATGVEVTGIPTSPVNLGRKRYTSTTETTGGSTIDVTDIIDTGGPKTGRLAWEEITP